MSLCTVSVPLWERQQKGKGKREKGKRKYRKSKYQPAGGLAQNRNGTVKSLTIVAYFSTHQYCLGAYRWSSHSCMCICVFDFSVHMGGGWREALTRKIKSCWRPQQKKSYASAADPSWCVRAPSCLPKVVEYCFLFSFRVATHSTQSTNRWVIEIFYQPTNVIIIIHRLPQWCAQCVLAQFRRRCACALVFYAARRFCLWLSEDWLHMRRRRARYWVLMLCPPFALLKHTHRGGGSRGRKFNPLMKME